MLLAGDLDAEPDAGSLRFLTGKQALNGISVCYCNAWDSVHPNDPGHTFSTVNPLTPRSWPFQRIDHTLIRCGSDNMPTLAIASCKRAFDTPVGGTWASHHFDLVAIFETRWQRLRTTIC